nr:MAG TPA: hypothetical protein [Caudoviricetes sp.]
MIIRAIASSKLSLQLRFTGESAAALMRLACPRQRVRL